MGSFTYDVITLGGGGGFQMMTIDDEGEGGVLANDDVIIGTTIFWQIFGIFQRIFQNFPKNFKIWTEIFNFSRKSLLTLRGDRKNFFVRCQFGT